jgi:hypothetical protein
VSGFLAVSFSSSFFRLLFLVVGSGISEFSFFFLWANGEEQSVPMNAAARSDQQPPPNSPKKTRQL